MLCVLFSAPVRVCAAIPTVVCYYENCFKEASSHWPCSFSLRIPLESEPGWRLHLLLQLTTVKKQCAVFVTSPNRTPSCPNFRFPPTSSTGLLTIPDIRMCLYRVTFKTWAGPGSFYTDWEALDQIRSAPGDSWDFWVILKTNVFLKDVIAFHFAKNLYASMNFITKFIKWRTFSSFYFQFSKLPSWFKACALLWMEKERTENLLPDQCPPLSNNIPSFSLIGPKKKKKKLI